MLRLLIITFLHLTALSVSIYADGDVDREIIVLVGASGSDKYQDIFSATADKWKVAAERGEAAITFIGNTERTDDETSDAEKLRLAIERVTAPELWVVLIGHGTFDSRSVKFNTRGPDFTDSELAAWLTDYEGELAVINTASASGSFIQHLSAPKRIIITATKNESEVFYTRFGGFFAEAIGGLPDADIDNDKQVSLLESFLYASAQVAGFYEDEQRLATEHGLIDDNGDNQGSRSEWYEGTTATQVPGKDLEPDGERAGQKVLVRNEFERRLTSQQRSQRDELERRVRQLRRTRDEMEEDAYYGKLEELLLQLARIYDKVKDS
tara:strand:- start:334 stop:1305 length:972 start_codon:yes stop_codon:yes gene_type:complete